jgi:transglutaminase-like putative cysteine protease
MTKPTKHTSLILAVVVCGMLLAQPRAYAHKDSAPDWVHDAAKETLPVYPHDPNAVVLLDDSEYTVRPDGHVVVHERIVRKILRPEGRKEADFIVWYNKDSKINWMHVWSIGADGHEYEMKDNEFIDGSEWSSMLYADDRYRWGHAPAGDPGAIVAEEYQKELPYYRPEVVWGLNGENPVHRNRMTVQLPPGFLFDTGWKRHDSIKPTDQGNNRWQWELMDTPGVDLRDVKLAPVGGALRSFMTLHYAVADISEPEDWKTLGVWYDGLVADRTEPTPEMVSKARDLTAGVTDFYSKAQAIDAFVRGDIRYVAVKIGIGGYQPHASSAIFRNRYGDCKDKTTLLVAMLSSVGIRATWLMVDTEHTIDPAMPSLLGDHMVAAIELPQGYTSPEMHSVVTAKSGKRFLITDPTWEYTPFGQIEDDLQGSYGLLVDGGDSQAIQIPVMDPDRNTWTRTAHMKLAADGSLSGDVVEQLYGDMAADMRQAFAATDAHRQSEMLQHHVNADLTGFTMTNVKTENMLDVDKEIVLSYMVATGSYAKSMGSLLLVRPRVLGSDETEVDDKPRNLAINFGESMRKKDEFDVQLPDGYVVDELPDPVKIDVGFASYESKTTLDKNTLHYSRTYTVRAIEVPAKQYGDVKELEGAIASDERNNVILRKAQ